MKIKGGGFAQLFLSLGLLVGISTAARAEMQATSEPEPPDRFEILIADSSARALESLFGEVSLLALPKEARWDEGVVVNLAANTQAVTSKAGHYLKSFIGSFPFQLDIIPSRNYFNQTLIYEKRDVRRLILPLTTQQKKNLWRQIQYFQANPKSLGDYYFNFRNGVAMLYLILNKSGIQVNPYQVMIRNILSLPGDQPVDIPEISRSVLLSPFPPVILPSISKILQRLEKKYDLHLRSEFDKGRKQFVPWSNNELQIFRQMSTEELVIAAQGLDLRDTERTPTLQQIIRDRRQWVSVQFVRYQNYPDSFYTICEPSDSSCDTQLIQDMASVYSLETLKSIYSLNRTDELRAEQLRQPEFLFQTSEQSQHWHRLTAALRAYLKTKR